MNRRAGLDRIVVVGGGITGLCAAIAFRRALPRTAVSLIAPPADPAALADRLPAVDQRGLALLARIGIGEEALVAAGAATHRVGQTFAWGDAAFTIGEGDGVAMLAGTALHQLWHAHGDGAFDDVVPGAALAKAERFVHPDDRPDSLLSHVDYALRLDPDRASSWLRHTAERAGIVVSPAARVSPEWRDGRCAALVVDGTRVEADLLIDASGPRALLASDRTAWIDWSATLPIDRLLLGTVPSAPSPCDRYDATDDGWTARWPLLDRTLVGTAFAADAASDARAKRLAPARTERIDIRPRRQVAPFAGNVLALGDAAAAVGPLGWLGLPLALAQLDIALHLMPARGDGPLLASEYNRRATLAADHIHAYAAAFYLAKPLRRGAFWRSMRDRTAPPELASALVQFGRRGSLPPIEEAMVPRGLWQQTLIGLGVRPQIADPVAGSVSAVSAVAALSQLRRAVAALPATLPRYPDYLAGMMKAVA